MYLSVKIAFGFKSNLEKLLFIEDNIAVYFIGDYINAFSCQSRF